MPNEETNNYISVDIDEYTFLVEARKEQQMLLSVLLKTSRLSWDGKTLVYDDDMITAIIQSICPNFIDNRIEDLQREKQNNEKDR